MPRLVSFLLQAPRGKGALRLGPVARRPCDAV